MIQKLLLSSRPKRIPSNNTLVDMKVICHVLERTPSVLARINLGTFSGQQPIHKVYHLHFDTGSDMIWLQCEDCAKPDNRCFQQKGVPYPNRGSISYVSLPCDRHPLYTLGQYIGTHCSYMKEYDEGSFSHGILAYETLTFGSSRQPRGEMMSWGTHSFMNQITEHSQGRFSYCLPPLTSDGFQAASTALWFGFDVPGLTSLHRLPIWQHSRELPYYVNLQEISINSRRLNIPSAYFAKTGPNKGGCVRRCKSGVAV
uniref:Xylanase inhibitor N-terminal domain-containing protein n=1 Tax=Kalanchoe fedtschenkoi TaxID=63787 RepID=A0A7N0VIS6_KALFE